jgi:RimJ/RimL family protein N-acetyltransferase
MLQIGPFCYFAGNFGGEAAAEMIRKQEPYFLFMTYPDQVFNIAKECFGERLIRFPRCSFSSDGLSVDHVGALLKQSPFRSRIARISKKVLDHVSSQPDHFLDISVFKSADDFLTKGIGFEITHNGKIAGVAYSSLVSNSAIEVSIYVETKYRRQGMATALGCALIKECLKRDIDPHWDAANVESCTLAEKLGYVSTGTYDAYYVSRPQSPK